MFSAALGITVKRNIGQSRDGGNDINVGPLVVECKRRKTLGTVESWLLQAAAACDTSAHIPIVVGRSDNGRSLVVLDLDHFIDLTQERLLEETEEQPKPVDAYFKQRASEIIGKVDL